MEQRNNSRNFSLLILWQMGSFHKILNCISELSVTKWYHSQTTNLEEFIFAFLAILHIAFVKLTAAISIMKSHKIKH